MTLHYLFLAIAIVFEVLGTTAMALSNGFSRLVPTSLCLGAYALSFAFLAQTLKLLPVGIVYAVWSGTGVVLITVVGWMFLRQPLDMAAVIGILLIVTGVVVINLYSGSIPH